MNRSCVWTLSLTDDRLRYLAMGGSDGCVRPT